MLYRPSTLRTVFTAFVVASAFIAFIDILLHICRDIDICILLNDIQYIGNVSIAPLIILTALAYTDRMPSKRGIGALFVLPALTLFMVWTDPWTNLYYSGVSLVISDGLTLFHTTWGPFWFLHIGYSLLLLIGAGALVIRSAVGRDPHIMFLAVMSPIIFNLTLLSGNSMVAVYSSSLGSLITSTLVFWVAFRHDAVDLTPIAYSTLLDNLEDAAIISDSSGKIIDANGRGATIIDGAELVGVNREGANGIDLMTTLRTMNNQSIDLRVDGEIRSYLVKFTSLTDRRSNHKGDLMLLLDHTDMVRMNTELIRANSRLDLIRSVGRHDLANQLMVLDGYANLLGSTGLDKDASSYLSRMRRSTANIGNMVDLMGLFGHLGEQPPSWYPLDVMVRNVVEMAEMDGIDVRVDLPPVCVKADPMIERALLNIIENCRLHGGKASHLDIKCCEEDDSLLLSLMDDGKGVPLSDKCSIFNRGYGSNTGFGLFACREILSMTGMTISETGEEGSGAHFIIRVPPGSWSMDPDRSQP